MKQYKKLENGIVYTLNGNFETKIIMGKKFICAQVFDQNGNKYLIPINKLEDNNLYKSIN
jgi:hypothetical protein